MFIIVLNEIKHDRVSLQVTLSPAIQFNVFYVVACVCVFLYRAHGNGRMVILGGRIYDGEFVHGRFHGNGQYEWPEGTVYIGDFEFDKMTGNGSLHFTDGGKYEGGVINGIRYGKGVQIIPSNEMEGVSSIYEGDWVNGKRHGEGIMYYNKEKTSFYSGGWVEGRRHGIGTLQYESGNTYIGQWNQDIKEGDGEMRWITTNECYIGSWYRNYPHGYGTHIWRGSLDVQSTTSIDKSSKKRSRPNTTAHWQMDNRYEGDFVQGLRHGIGTFYYSDGGKYVGQWWEGRKHGEGMFIFADGVVYDGAFNNDIMVSIKISPLFL